MAPERRYLSSENYAPWVDKSLKSQMKIRDRMRGEAIEGKITWDEHDKKKKEVRRLLSKAENAWKAS